MNRESWCPLSTDLTKSEPGAKQEINPCAKGECSDEKAGACADTKGGAQWKMGWEAGLPGEGHLGVEEGQEPAWQGCPGQQK